MIFIKYCVTIVILLGAGYWDTAGYFDTVGYFDTAEYCDIVGYCDPGRYCDRDKHCDFFGRVGLFYAIICKTFLQLFSVFLST